MSEHAETKPKKNNRLRLYNVYCSTVSAALELARILGLKTCDKCGRKV